MRRRVAQESPQKSPDLTAAQAIWCCIEFREPEKIILPIHHVKDEVPTPLAPALLVNFRDLLEGLTQSPGEHLPSESLVIRIGSWFEHGGPRGCLSDRDFGLL